MLKLIMYRPYCFLHFETGCTCIFCDLQAEAEETADDVNTTLDFLSIANFTKDRSLGDIDYYLLVCNLLVRYGEVLRFVSRQTS
jgi:hypothetical protein